jgi:tripartite-type tricarboxylate transporter receptor subunit TctC
MNMRRRYLSVGFGLGLALPMPTLFAQPSGAKVLRIVHGYEGGTNPDTISRIISNALGERLGQSVIVEAKPGAAGRIATRYVATQPADGNTLIMLTAGDAVLAALDAKLQYNLLKDFAFVSSVIESPLIFCVATESPIKTLPELIAAARKDPGKLSFGTPGIGTTQHMAGELLQSLAGIQLTHVPYKTNAFPDLFGGRLDFLIAAPSVSMPQISGNKARGIAVTSRTLLAAAPGVPSVGQTIPGYEVMSWLGLAVPAGTTPDRVQKLSNEVQVVVATDEVRKSIAAGGSLPASSSGEAFKARIETDVQKWRGLSGRVKLEG